MIREKYSFYQKKGNLRFILILFFFIGGYLFFFTSNAWMPAGSSANALTPPGQEKEWNGRTVSVIRWDYCEASGKMEVELDIQNTSYDGQNSYEYSALEKLGGTLSVSVILEEADWVILQISDLPKRWSEVSLRMDMTERAESMGLLKLYTNVNDVNRVSRIEERDRDGYRIVRFETQIQTYQNRIKTLQEEIQNLESEKQEISRETVRLQEGRQYQTLEQQRFTDQAVAEAESKYKSAEAEIAEKQKEITEMNERITLTRKQMEEGN